MFNCEKCGKEFKKKEGLNYHTKNFVCTKKKKRKFICQICNIGLSSKRNLELHLNKQICENGEKIKKINVENIKIEEKITKLENTVEMLKKYPQIINNNNVNNTENNIENNITFNIFPSAFGQEDFNKILNKIPNLIIDSLKNPNQSVKMMVDKIHCNHELPEYNNVYISDEKQGIAKISDGKRFVRRPQEKIIAELIDSKRSMIDKYIDGNENITNKLLRCYNKYQNRLDDDVDTLKDLEKEIICLLLDMNDVIEGNNSKKMLDINCHNQNCL